MQQVKQRKISAPTIIAIPLALFAIAVDDLGIFSERVSEFFQCAVLAYVILLLIFNIFDIYQKK